jgi:transposase
MAADKGSLDIESLLSNQGNAVHQIEKLGAEKFKRFFLFPEGGITSEEIAAECDLKISEVEAINSFVNDFAIMSEFYHPSESGSQIVTYTKIASVEKCEEGFVIGYFSPAYARGRYSIDYGSFEQLLAAGRLNTDEIKEARRLFKKLELINHRKDTINNILQSLVRKQVLYLESGNPMSLLPFSQKELAKDIGLAPSSVSRAIQAKSLVTPWGKEVPLKHFLPTPKRFKKELVRQLLQTEPGLTSDEATRARLREKTGIAISRRSVTELRKELKIPARGKIRKDKEIR